MLNKITLSMSTTCSRTTGSGLHDSDISCVFVEVGVGIKVLVCGFKRFVMQSAQSLAKLSSMSEADFTMENEFDKIIEEFSVKKIRWDPFIFFIAS
jgi:hypothetical protein